MNEEDGNRIHEYILLTVEGKLRFQLLKNEGITCLFKIGSGVQVIFHKINGGIRITLIYLLVLRRCI